MEAGLYCCVFNRFVELFMEFCNAPLSRPHVELITMYQGKAIFFLLRYNVHVT